MGMTETKLDLMRLINHDLDVRKAIIDLIIHSWRSNNWDFYWNMNDYNEKGLSKYPRSASGQLQLPKSVEELEKKWGGVTPESIKEKSKINIEDLITKEAEAKIADNFIKAVKEDLTIKDTKQETWFSIPRADKINGIVKIVRKIVCANVPELQPYSAAASHYVIERVEQVLNTLSCDAWDDVYLTIDTVENETRQGYFKVFNENMPKKAIEHLIEDLNSFIGSYCTPSEVRVVVDKTEPKNFSTCSIEAKKPTLQEALKHILKDAVESNSYGVRDLMEGN